MTRDRKNRDPEGYFEELLKDTPMGPMRLLAAFDSLSTETQIRLLTALVAKNRTELDDRAVWLKALSSQSEYVRYLGARAIAMHPGWPCA